MELWSAAFGGDCCMALGVFDGVHRGHQRILEALRTQAARHGVKAIAVTFDPHPRAVLAPDQAPPLLMPLEERIRYLRRYGADEVMILSFDRDFANLAPATFLERLLQYPEGRRVHALVVGSGWRFGVRGSGDREFLEREAAHFHYEFTAVEELEYHGAVVSSTAIRKFALAGQLEEAAAMLGRPYALYGTVEAGFQAASHDLGHPTANLKINGGVLPPDGVYAARVFGRPAAVNIGVAPTYRNLNGMRRRVEAHILDWTEDLYGRELEVELLSFLREERTFPNPAELRRQIESDVAEIRRRTQQQEPTP